MVIDHILIGVYLVFMLLLGVYNRSRGSSLNSYGKIEGAVQYSRIFLVATIFANSVGGGTAFGISEKVFSGNLSYTYALLLAVFADVLIGLYILPACSKHYGVISVGDIMHKYYSNTGRFIAGVSATVVSFGYIAAQINVSSRIFEYVMKMNRVEGVIFSYLIVIIYTAAGGLRSIIFTNFLQFLSIIIGIPIISIVGIYKIGFVEFASAVPDFVRASHANHNAIDVLMLCLSLSFMGITPALVQRGFVIKDAERIKSAVINKCIIYVVFILVVTLNGFVAKYMYGQLPEGFTALSMLINDVIPTGLRGMVIIGLLAAVMSTADSDLNIASISMTNDVLRSIYKFPDTKIGLMAARILTVILGILAVYFALIFDNPIDLVMFVAGFWVPMMVVPLVFALYGRVVQVRIFVLGSLIGACVFVAWEIFCPIRGLKGSFVGMLSQLILYILCSFRANYKSA